MFKIAQLFTKENFINKVDTALERMSKFVNKKQPGPFKLSVGNIIENTKSINPTKESWKEWTLHNIAARESSFNSKVRGQAISNGERAMGLFQFMPSTAREYGITDINAFLNNPKLQYETASKFFDKGLEYAKNYGVKIDYNNNPMEAAKHMYGYWYGGPGYFKNLTSNPGYLNAKNYAGGQEMPSIVQALNKFQWNAVPYVDNFKSPNFNFK